MSTPEPTKSEATKHTTAAAAAPAAPVVVVEEKKKRKYSRGLREVQQVERGVAKANRRISAAVADGFAEYFRRDEASSRKRRDGAIRDAVKNWTKGLSKALRKGAKAPQDLGDALNTKTVRRTVRQVTRFFAPPFLR